MFVKGRSSSPVHALCWIGIGSALIGSGVGCHSPGACTPEAHCFASSSPGDRFRTLTPPPASPSGQRPALGMIGLTSHDLKKLGPLKDRVEEINHHSLSGPGHILFTRALTYPGVAGRIAAYTSWGDVADGAGKRNSTRDLR